MVISYKSDDSSLPIVFNCSDCFNIYDEVYKYGVFVAGIDTNTNSIPSLDNKDWVSEQKKAKNPTDFVVNSYKNNCIFGIVAIDNSISSYTVMPGNISRIRQIDNDNNKAQYKLKVWSVKDKCPHKDI